MPSPKQQTPERWLEEIEHGLEYRRKFGLEDLWGTFEAIYYNTHESMMNDGPNIFLSQGDAMLSTITVPSAQVRVRPTKPEEVDKAPLVEALDNTLLRELNIEQEVESAALHAYLFGRGILKIGYDSEWGYDPEYDLGGSLQLGLTLTQLTSKGDRRIEYDSSVTPGSPWIRALMPHDFVVPWGVKEISHSPWVAHRFIRHIDDLRADRKYNTSRLEPSISMEDFVNSYRVTSRPRMRNHVNTRKPEYVEMYEIHDRRTGKIFVVTANHDKFLRNDDNALQIDNQLPFVSVGFTPRARAFWTTPDVFYLYYIQNELSDVARQRTKQRRISTLKFLYDEGKISEEELQKILSPEVGVAGKVESGVGDISTAVIKLDNSPNQQLGVEEELLRSNAREQIGFSRNQLGEYTGGRKTATEVSAVDRSSQLRMSRRGLAIKRLYEDSVRIINGIVFSYWTLPRYVSVMGEENAERWLRVNGPMLKGRYAYNVTFTDESALEARKLQALELYGMLAADPSVDPVELRNFLVNQVNDPAFARLFNADVRNAVSQVQQGGGAVRSPSRPGGESPVAVLQRQNGQAGQQGPTGLLAGGRPGA